MIGKILLLVAFLSNAANAAYSFRDEFNTYDESNWRADVHGNPHNNELQYYTDRYENLHVEDGHLVIKPIKEDYGGRSYTSARINSYFAWKYGRVEVRAKIPNGYGLWPAIWMMPRDSVYGGWPYSGEIDICEARGDYMYEIASTIHYQASWGHAYTSSGDLETQCPIDDWHIYTLDWTPTELVWRFDNNPYYKIDISGRTSDYYTSDTDPFDQYFYLILNVAVGGHYLDDPKPSTVWYYPDAEMHVDYVRVSPLEDIADCGAGTGSCQVKEGSDVDEVCANAMWACNDQNWADVSNECTDQLYYCCERPYLNCDQDTVYELASAVYASYDEQVNDDNSCNFSGTATDGGDGNGECTLYDGGPGEAVCVIDDDATNSDICGAMQWACYDNEYTDVSSECFDANGSAALSCCNVNPWTCDDELLRTAAGEVFQLYYSNMPSSSSCDFGGVCHLEGGSSVPLACA